MRLPMIPPARQSDPIRSIVRRYYFVSTSYVFGPMFIMAVYPLFLRSRGLNQFQINVVTALYVLTTFFTDLPTGAHADAVGRRAAVVAGCAAHALAFLIYFLSHDYWWFVLAAICDGIGATFGNGPIDAWAIDALDAAGFEGTKDAMFSRRFQFGHAAGICATLAGAYLAQINIAAPFVVTAMVWVACGCAALLMMGRSRGRKTSLSKIFTEIRRRSIDSTVFGFSDRSVRLLSIAGLLSSLMWAGWGQEWQQYFNRGLNSGIGVVGWVSVALIGAQLVGLEVAARIRNPAEHRAALVGSMVAISCAAIIAAGMAEGHVRFALAAVMTATFTMGVAGPLGFAWFNEMIGGENRTTLLSFHTTLSTLGAAVGLPAQGALVDTVGTGVTWQIAGLVSMTRVLIYVALGYPRGEPEEKPAM